jgi:hypothetical protein
MGNMMMMTAGSSAAAAAVVAQLAQQPSKLCLQICLICYF